MAEPVRDARMLAGVAAAAVALGVTELLAVPFGPQADARTAIGSTVIDLTPGPVKEWAIQTFGTADKLFLSVLVLGVIALLAAVTARWETRRVPVGSAAILVAGIAGCAAVLSRAGTTLFDIALDGSGTASGNEAFRGGIYLPQTAVITYNFADTAATPEPASMILLGTGVAGLMVRCRKRT